MKKDIDTTIEITDSHIKLFQAKEVRGKKVICSCDIKPVNNQSDAEVVKILNELILSKSIQADRFTLIIPRRLVIFKHMRLPSNNMNEIRKMLGLQLVNKIPYSISDVIFDYQVLESDNSGYTQILAIIVHRDVSQKYNKILNQIGVHASKFSISSMGLLGWLRYQQGKKSLQVSGPVILVNVDLQHSEICFCQNDKLIFSRSVAYGAKELNSETLVKLVHQIELSLGTYTKENMGASVDRILILSTIAEAQQLKVEVESFFKIPTSVVTSLENVLSQKKINLASLKQQMGVSLAVGLGFLLGGAAGKVNLMPPEVGDNKKSKIVRLEFAKFAAFVVLVTMLIVSSMGLKYYKENKQYLVLKERHEKIETELKQVSKKTEFVGFFEKVFSKRVVVADLVVSLFQLTNEDISFRSLDLDDKGGFTIQGYAQTSSSVSQFQKGLVESSVFQDVNLVFATKRKIFNMEVTDFKLICHLADI